MDLKQKLREALDIAERDLATARQETERLEHTAASLRAMLGPEPIIRTVETANLALYDGSDSSGERFSPMRWVEGKLGELDGDITQPRLMEILKREHPNVPAVRHSGTLTGVLERLEKRGVVQKIKPGNANEPSVYRRVGETGEHI